MRNRLWGVVAILFGLPAISPASDCTAAYQAGLDHYSALVQSWTQKKSSSRAGAWQELAQEFQAVAEKYPDCHKADDAWFQAGKILLEHCQSPPNPDQLNAALSDFQVLIQKYPDSTLADDAQFYRGRAYELLGDPAQARIEYQLTIQRYRRGDMVREAQARLDKIPKIAATGPTTPPAPKPAPAAGMAAGQSPLPSSANAARPQPPALPTPGTAPPTKSQNPLARLIEIRYWSSKDYTRVVVDLDREVAFLPPHLLRPDPSLGTPPRLYLDFPGTALSREFKQKTPLVAGFYDLPIGDGLLKRARAGQPQETTSRVVLDLESVASYHCFPLPGEEGGFRVILDIRGQKPPAGAAAAKAEPPVPAPQTAPTIPRPSGAPVATPAAGPPVSPSPAPAPPISPSPGPQPPIVKPEPATDKPSTAKPEPPAINRQPGAVQRPPSTANRQPPAKYLIVIDPGHGGKDPGAIGPGRVREKDVALAVAKKLKTRLEKENPNVKVALTRNDDRYLSLVERTAMANTLNANLFISIHCNASPNRQAAGIETYFLDNTTDRAALKLAARENFVREETLTKPDDYLNDILADMTTTTKVEGSVPLAGLIQESLVRELKKEYSGVNNLGVKKAPFWVLTGAMMPCVLIETSFISNRKEEKRLASSAFQDDLARATAKGLSNYLENYPRLAALDGE